MAIEIVVATPALLNEIEVWLRAEDDAYRKASAILSERWDPEIELPERGFLCNWNLVQRSFGKDPENVHVLLVDGVAMGFVDEMDILEVHPAHRTKGWGRHLADFMLKWAFDLGHSVAEIEVAPDAALPFWRRMGFTVDMERRGYGGGIYAFRRFERTQALGSGRRAPYRIAFHDKSRDWDPAVEPFSAFAGDGEVRADGTILLPERAYCFNPGRETSMDSVVRIEVDGALTYEDKVKRPTAQAIGLMLDPGGVYFFDHIAPGLAPA